MLTMTDEKLGGKFVVAELATQESAAAQHCGDASRPDLGGPPEPSPTDARDVSMLDLIELLLKDQQQLDRLSQSQHAQRRLVPRLLAIGLIGYTVFGVTLSVFFAAARVWPELTATADWLGDSQRALIDFAPRPDVPAWQDWLDGSALKLTAAFALGMIGAIGICLPSFYFYGLLAGVQTSMLQVTTLALKGMASGAVALLGALPLYFAVVLGLVVFAAPHGLVASVCVVGLALPFITGLWGTRSLYIAFVSLAETMKPEQRRRRECFLRRLLFSWSACFTAVTPVAIFTLWQALSS